MRELSTADLRRSRLHLFWIQLLLTLAVAALVVGEILRSSEAYERPPLGSTIYLLDGLAVTAMVLAVTVWFVPVWTLVWMVPVAWLLPLGGSEVAFEWRALSVGCVAALAWILLRSRRIELGGARRRPPISGPFEESWAFRHSRLGWIALAGGVLLTAGLLVAHQVQLNNEVAFEERAETVIATLISVDDDAATMVLRLGDEDVTLDEPLDWVRPEIGAEVMLLTDPEDPERIVPLVDLPDPSWLFGLALAAPLVGLWLGVPVLKRSRRRQSLARLGAAAVLVKLTCSDDGDFTLHPTDGGPLLLEVGHVDGAVGHADMVAFMNDWDEDGDPDADDNEEGEDDDEEAGRLPESDAVLASWADEVRQMWRSIDEESEGPRFSPDMSADEKLMAEADVGPDVGDGEPFAMVGPWSHGSTVALLRGSGQVWFAEIREPRFMYGPRPHVSLFSRADRHELARFRRGVIADAGTVGPSVFGWVRANSSWVRWVLPLAVGILTGVAAGLGLWGVIDEGGGWFSWIRTISGIIVFMTLPRVVTAWFGDVSSARVREGFVSYGLLLDTIIAPDRLVSITAGEDAVAVRLQDPEGALAVFPEEVGTEYSSEEAAAELRLWFAAAPADARSTRRPSPVLVAGAVQVIVAATVAVLFLT